MSYINANAVPTLTVQGEADRVVPAEQALILDKALEAAGVKVVVEQSGTVKDVLDRLNRNGVAFADQPNAEAHW